MARFVLDYPNDETRVLIDRKTNEELMRMNHDRDGWQGMDRLSQFVDILNRVVR